MAMLTTWGYLIQKSQKKEKMDAKKVKIVSLVGGIHGVILHPTSIKHICIIA
jgi:hypothetical protein